MADIINGVVFELIAGGLLWLNVRAIYRDKKVAGVDWRPFAFYACWGIWNPFYYWSLEQYWSVLGSIPVVSANITWLFLVWYYTKHASKNASLGGSRRGSVFTDVCRSFLGWFRNRKGE